MTFQVSWSIEALQAAGDATLIGPFAERIMRLQVDVVVERPGEGLAAEGAEVAWGFTVSVLPLRLR